MEWRRSQLAALACVSLVACEFGEVTDAGDAGRSDASRDAAADSGSRDAEVEDAGTADVPVTGPRLQVGTGAFEFEALSPGQVVDISSGPQGGGRYDGFHIWFGAKAWELDPLAMQAAFIILRRSDRTELGRLEWQTNFRPSASGDSYEIWGATPRLTDCCLAVSEELVMRVELLDAAGVSAANEIEVVGQDACADFSMNYCP